MISVADAAAVLQPLAADLDRRTKAEADAATVANRALLAAFDRDPAELRKLRATADAERVKVAQAEARLATAKAAHLTAVIAYESAAQALTAELVRLRRASFSLWRLAIADTQLREKADEYRAGNSASRAGGEAATVLIRAVQFLTGVRDGANDPPEDFAVFVQDALDKAAEVFRTQSAADDAARVQAAKAARTARILNS